MNDAQISRTVTHITYKHIKRRRLISNEGIVYSFLKSHFVFVICV